MLWWRQHTKMSMHDLLAFGTWLHDKISLKLCFLLILSSVGLYIYYLGICNIEAHFHIGPHHDVVAQKFWGFDHFKIFTYFVKVSYIIRKKDYIIRNSYIRFMLNNLSQPSFIFGHDLIVLVYDHICVRLCTFDNNSKKCF